MFWQKKSKPIENSLKFIINDDDIRVELQYSDPELMILLCDAVLNNKIRRSASEKIVEIMEKYGDFFTASKVSEKINTSIRPSEFSV